MRGWAIALLIAFAPSARAQLDVRFGLPRADSLLARGQLLAAESEYYAAASARTHDPIARAALGRYLAARGALKVAVVLLEEARQFGGDPAVIARDLAPLYMRLGDYPSLARLPQSPLDGAQRSRVAMLVALGSSVRMGSTARLTWQPADDAAPMGRIRVSISDVGRNTSAGISGANLDAAIDPATDEILVGTAIAVRNMRPGGPRDDVTMGVADTLSGGDVIWTNVPMQIGPGARSASIGLGFLLRYAPTFDARERTLTLHATGTVGKDPAAARYPALFLARGPVVLVGGRWLPLGSAEFRGLTAGKRFTIDLRRGEIEIAR